MYCVDPSDGHGKFSLVSPHRPGPRVLPDDKRRPLCNMLLKVDAKAQPFRERLELEASINEDLVLTATAWSLNQKGRVEAEVHDLEFALATPGAKSGWLRAGLLEGEAGEGTSNEAGELVMRSNIAAREDESLVPGELMYRINPYYFRVEQSPPQVQVEEHLYYQPCAYCRRPSNDPQCRCASSPASRQQEPARPSA
jgi:molecular chaperone DnaK